MAAKTPKHSTKKEVSPEPPWILEPVLNPKTGFYSYKYHKKNAS